MEEDINDFEDRDSSFHTPQESESVIESTVVTIENDRQQQQLRNRPDSLILNTTTIETKPLDSKKFLYRSQSTKVFKKPKVKPSKVFSNDLDQIYVISSNSCMTTDDFYDSIDVISERRNKNFSKFNELESDKTIEVDTSKNETVVETTVEIEPQRT